MPVKESVFCNYKRWIDVAQPTMQEMEELSGEYKRNPYMVRDCMEPAHLPKYDIINNIHFLIIRFYSHASDSRLSTIQELTNKLAIFYTDDFLITVHAEEVPFFNVIRNRHVQAEQCATTIDVIIKILLHVLETYNNPVVRISEQIDFYEGRMILRKSNAAQLEALYFIKRQVSSISKVLMLLQEPISHIRMPDEDDAALQDIQDQHLRIQTMYNQALEDINNLMNLYMSFAAQRTNEVVRVLTVFSVFFMPLTFIVGIYGMNFQHMPELEYKYGYPVVIIAMALIIGVIYYWFKRKEWL